MNICRLMTLIVLILISNQSYADKIDWNDGNIQWLNYEEGTAKLEATGNNGLILLYADWCSTCKKYSALFQDASVVKAMMGITVIRANVDEVDAVKDLSDYDKSYVPKTIAIDKLGKVVEALHNKDEEFMFYIPSDDKEKLLDFIASVKASNGA